MEQGESSTQSGGEEEEKSGEEKKKGGQDEKEKKKEGEDEKEKKKGGEDEKEKKKEGEEEKNESDPVDGEEEAEIWDQCDTKVKENHDDGLEICDNCDICEEEEEEEENSCEEESECFTRRDVSVQVLQLVVQVVILNCSRLIPLYSSRVSINRTLHIIIMPSQVGD